MRGWLLEHAAATLARISAMPMSPEDKAMMDKRKHHVSLTVSSCDTSRRKLYNYFCCKIMKV